MGLITSDRELECFVEAMQLFSIVLCLILIYGNSFNLTYHKRRSWLFNALLLTNLFTSAGDFLAYEGYRFLPEWMLVPVTAVPYFGYFVFYGFCFAYVQEVGTDRNETGITMRIPIVVSIIFSVISLTLCFTGNMFSYEGTQYSGESGVIVQYLMQIFVILMLALVFWLRSSTYSNYEKFGIAFFLLAPFLCTIIIWINPLASFGAPALSVTLLIMFIIVENYDVGKTAEKIQEAKSLAMQSQIRPHFINNTLYNIKALYAMDPLQAGKLLDSFAEYLNGHKEALEEDKLWPFSTELENLKCYMDIEEERFQNIHAEYDIQTTDFMIPPLTLQPLVENAINHGLRQKPEGGTVWLKTWQEDEETIVTVEDDGVGFNSNKRPEDNRQHLGVENTRFRIEIMCKGTMRIASRPGEGTTVTIRIPRA